ncbi:ABC transporter substrate-binding protein [soil metagenome]
MDSIREPVTTYENRSNRSKPTASGLVTDYLSGRIERRELLRRAAAVGALVPVLSIMAGSKNFAHAQDSTPLPDPDAGNTIEIPDGLRTDLEGTQINAVLADATDPNGPFLEAAIAKFTEATGIGVNFLRGETQTDARLQAYRQQWAGQSSEIDVFQIDVIWPGVVAEHAVDLTEVLADLAAQHFTGIVENNTVDGRLVGIPWFTDAGLLYYRSDLLEKYDFEPPTTWSELEAAAQAIQDGEREENPDFKGFIFQGRAYEGLTCNGLEWQVSQGGGTIVDADGNVTVNNDQAVAAFERAASWVNGIAPEGVTTYREPETFNVWVAGNAAFSRNWPYQYAGSQQAQAVAGNVGVAPLPMGESEGSRNAATLGGWQLFVSRYSNNQEASIEFLKFLCSPEVQKSFAVERSMLPTIPSVYEDADVAEASEFIPRLLDVFQAAVGRPSGSTGDIYPEISAVYYQQLNQVLSGAKSAQDAAESMENEMNAILEEG